MKTDRRGFLARTSMWMAGSVVAGLIPGCADFEDEIPCLGTAAAPTPVPGMTYLWASKIGCALDCDLKNGRNRSTGGRATDDGPRINAAMAGASESNPITLIIDGPALVSGLFLPAGGYWSIAGLGCGTGFFIKSGTNNDGIHNGGPNAAIPSDPGPPVPSRGSSVSLQNFTINGNQGNGFNGVSTTGAPQGNLELEWYYSINLMNLDNIEVENVVVVNSPSYHMRFSNVGNVKISGCVLRSQGPNTDGLHFDGPSNDIAISDCEITSGDDAIALNCPEGHRGNISRVTISNCKVNSGTFLLRLHSVDGPLMYNIDTVTVSNCTGACAYAGFLVGHGAPSNPESITGVTIANCALSAPAMLEVGANFGSIVLDTLQLTPQPSSLLPGFALVRSSLFSAGCTYVGSSLDIKNCEIQRRAGSMLPALVLNYTSSIGQLTFDGFMLQAGSTTPALVDIASGTLGQLVINSVNSAGIKNPISSGGFSSCGTVSGTGVLATGWEFPDDVMCDGVPYISAETGLPSIKIDGVVEPYAP